MSKGLLIAALFTMLIFKMQVVFCQQETNTHTSNTFDLDYKSTAHASEFKPSHSTKLVTTPTAIIDEEDSKSVEQSSFGIRSFTVEVTTATEKPSYASHLDSTNAVGQTYTNLKISKPRVSLNTESSLVAFQGLNQSNNNKVLNYTSNVLESLPKPIPSKDFTPSPNVLNERPLAGKNAANGLYRIKIAEIITDEFDNGLGDSSESDTKRRINPNILYNNGKINIADLYPSKLEDFSPIIKQSNEKLIQEKHLFVIENDDQNGDYPKLQEINTIELQQSHENTINKGGPTTNIEIALIDDGTYGMDTRTRSEKNPYNEKITDFTNQLLQENDGIINTIERSFANVNIEHTTSTAAAPITKTNDKQSGSVNSFIDRRVKKSDPTLNKKFVGINDLNHELAVANTKFNSKADHTEASDGTAAATKQEKPEFSTTKFYNSKELYVELLHQKNHDDVKEVTKTTDTQNHNKSNGISPTSDAAVTMETVTPAQLINKISTSVTQRAVVSTTPTLTSTILGNGSGVIMNNHKKSTSPRTGLFNVNTPKLNKTQINKARINQTNIITKGRVSSKNHKQLHLNSTKGSSSKMLSMLSKSVNELSTTPTIIHNYGKVNTKNIKLNDSLVTSTHIVSVQTATGSLAASTHEATNAYKPATSNVFQKLLSSKSHVISRLQEKLNSLDCDMQNELIDSSLWRGNETHELYLPNTVPENCSSGADCMPMIISWEGTADIQCGDVLIVEIDDIQLIPNDYNGTTDSNIHKATTTVYQVTRPGHEHCDVTEGVLLDITPLEVDGKKLVTLYDKDLTEGVNLLIVVSELWGQQCVRLKVTVKSDNCGENADCSGKGICYSNSSMEGYECQCCTGFAGSHCEEIDACSPSPCTNNGICVDLSQGHDGNSYQCLCPYGYTGKNCQFESDPCNPSECLNGGSCTGNTTHFRCDCTVGFTGPLCQHNINECESSPCVHGICVNQDDGFRCFCQPGFTGELCNLEYNECESNPCLNGAQCTDHIGGFSCKCTRGYSGTRCHIKVDFCANNPCPEGHRCNDRGDDFTCECPGGRNGPDCNQVPRTLCNINPCANGGTCWTSEESFYCACRPGFTGKMCEDEFIVETVVSSNEILSDDASMARPFGEPRYSAVVSKGSIGLHNAYVAAGTFITAIFIVAIVVIVCHCKFHQSYRRFTTRHHQLIPIFGFGRRTKSSAIHRHWLTGMSGANNTSAASTGAVTSAIGTQSSNKSNPPNMQYSENCQKNNGFNQCNKQQQEHRNHFNKHLAMNLENDMYYTVDFSDSQHSPLIQ